MVSSVLLNNYLYLDYLKFKELKSSELIRNLNQETGLCVKSILSIFNVILESSILIFLIVFLFFFQTSISIIFFSVFLILSSLYFFVMIKKLKNYGNKRIETGSLYLKYMMDGIKGFKEIKISNKQNYFINLFIRYKKIYLKTTRRVSLINIALRSWVELIVIIIIIFLLIYKNLSYLEPENTIITLTVFGAALFRILPSTGKVIAGLQIIQNNIPSINLISKELSIAKSKKLKINLINFKKLEIINL